MMREMIHYRSKNRMQCNGGQSGGRRRRGGGVSERADYQQIKKFTFHVDRNK